MIRRSRTLPATITAPVAPGTFRGADNVSSVMAMWRRDRDGATLVALQPVTLGDLLAGSWDCNGYTLISFTRI